MRCLALATLLILGACDTGGDEPPLPDANLSLPMCTGLVYDSCTGNAGCMSMNCKLFSGDGIQVCTQACDGATPCPTGGTCNNKGICKPAMANACHP